MQIVSSLHCYIISFLNAISFRKNKSILLMFVHVVKYVEIKGEINHTHAHIAP